MDLPGASGRKHQRLTSWFLELSIQRIWSPLYSNWKGNTSSFQSIGAASEMVGAETQLLTLQLPVECSKGGSPLHIMQQMLHGVKGCTDLIKRLDRKPLLSGKLELIIDWPEGKDFWNVTGLVLKRPQYLINSQKLRGDICLVYQLILLSCGKAAVWSPLW